MPSLNTRRHALGHTRVVVHPLKGKGGSYPLGVVPSLWLKASSYRSLSGKVHRQLESQLEGALARHTFSPTSASRSRACCGGNVHSYRCGNHTGSEFEREAISVSEVKDTQELYV